MKENLFLGMTFRDYVKSLVTPANAIAAAILLAGIPTIAFRFWKGLGAATNLSQTNPWGIWVAFDVVCGVALAAGGYTVACAVYIFGQKALRPILRPAILTGFLGYALVLFGLVVDLGQPWRLPYQFFLTPGTTAVMYEVGWCVFLYLMVLGLEFAPAALEWLGLVKLRRLLGSLTIGIIVIGVTLSTLHQSSLGAFFLMTPGKLHPLWYSPFLPIFFFVSSLSAGIGMVVVESALSHRAFHDRLDPAASVDLDRITLVAREGRRDRPLRVLLHPAAGPRFERPLRPPRDRLGRLVSLRDARLRPPAVVRVRLRGAAKEREAGPDRRRPHGPRRRSSTASTSRSSPSTGTSRTATSRAPARSSRHSRS